MPEVMRVPNYRLRSVLSDYMDFNADYIRLTGLRNTAAVEEFIDALCVDIVGIETVAGDTITLLVDESIDLSSQEDRAWLGEILSDILTASNETQATVEMIQGQ